MTDDQNGRAHPGDNPEIHKDTHRDDAGNYPFIQFDFISSRVSQESSVTAMKYPGACTARLA